VIWIISDTHLTKSHILPETFVRRVDREDIIFHLGDMVSFEIMEFLHTLCPVEAVRGNCDMPDVRRGLSPKKIIELDGKKIGLIHGQGGQLQTLQMVRQEFAGKVDIALFGHTHVPYMVRENGTLYLNPGSLRDGREGVNTYGILHLDDDPWGEIVEV
jgi:putative phosphoesterase